MSQKLPVEGFKWINDTSHFNENFIETYNENSNEECFLEVDVQFPKKHHDFYNGLPICFERMKIEIK